jgi:uncharacterized protein involved in type VI secretion and phage assembly
MGSFFFTDGYSSCLKQWWLAAVGIASNLDITSLVNQALNCTIHPNQSTVPTKGAVSNTRQGSRDRGKVSSLVSAE